MCGIAGEFIFDPQGRVDESIIVPMVSAIRHRGPDQWGYYLGCSGSVLLINTRLSIVDLANGRQPLSNEDGSIWVVLNGELYGFQDIAKDLESRGHRFRTHSDTEVIVHLYEEYGEDFVSHLRGEFAIALLDQRQDVLYLVRDRFGIKPLFYSRLTDSLVFGSEIKAILRHPKARARLDHFNLFHLLHGLLLPETTCFENIQTVEPGYMLRISRSGVTQRRYWDLPLAGEVVPASEEEAVEEFRRLFYEAVRLRLHGDVEVGAYVSGGLDSTSVASVAAEVSGRPVKAFTVAFENEMLNEGPAAAEFAKSSGFEHHVVRIGRGDLVPYFERSLWHSEMPVGNSHGAAKMILSELARRHVKVVLTGEGADEALAGYNVFQHIAQLDEVRTHPNDPQRRAALDALLKKERSGIALLNNGIMPIRALPQYDRVTGLFGAYPYAIARALRTGKGIPFVMSRHFRREVAGVDPIAEMAERIGRGRMAGLSPVAAHQYYLFKADLPAYILNYLGDRVEMAHSIEGRVPFLDHKLIEFAFGLPRSLKLRNGAGKYILRRAIAERLPSALLVKKRPFVAPTTETLGLSEGSEFAAHYLDSRVIRNLGLFNPHVIGALRRSLAYLPRGSRALSLTETMLTGVASIHAVHEMFCERFEDFAGRFSLARPDSTLADGRI
ncbi:MAG TPA: asparagine synthase (glutamine-hydrolyzing) [Terriglobales bacterium]|nr:asparagine synthase (glutamine-hydrolyzing) [Terriglobales bacterium]